MNLTPDQTAAKVYHDEIAPNMKPNVTLMFAHGFNIRFRTITPPPTVDVSLVAPKAPGHRVREVFTEGGGVPCLVAVEQDASGNALALALSYAKAIGGTRAGVLETTFTEETETDLFGEQAVLCGGTAALVKAGFETLTEAGYQPELAYFEVLHELKLIVDLMLSRRPRVHALLHLRHRRVGRLRSRPAHRHPRDQEAAMKQLLADIQDGSFAKKFINEERDRPQRSSQASATPGPQPPDRKSGAELRAAMPFLDPVKVVDGAVVKA